MSFLKKLFGQNSNNKDQSQASEIYQGFSITPQAMPASGQFRLCALIAKQMGDETKTHQLIRADLFHNKDEAAKAALLKARQVIDEQGDKIFG